MTANIKEFCSGAFFIVFGIATYFINRNYHFGDPSDIGPAFFPTILAVMLVIIGIGVLIRSFTMAQGEFPAINWRGIVAIMGGLLAFGLALRPLGLVPAVILLCVISQLGVREFRWFSMVAMPIVLAIGSTVIFTYGLGVLLPPFGTLFR